MPAATAERRSQLNILPPKDLLKTVLKTGEVFCRDEMLPVHLIDLSTAIVDTPHVNEMKQVMKGEFGVTQDGAVRVRFADDKQEDIVYDWIDGTHRTKGLQEEDKDGLTEMKYAVYYNCPDELLFRLRILAANNVKSIRFARICHYINDAWNITPWKNKVSSTQAFSLVATKATGTTIIKHQQDIDAIRNWATESARGWRMSPSTIFQHLHTYDFADPELVLKVRSGGTFQKGELGVTPSQLQIIVDTFPHHSFPGIQMLIARYASSGVSTPQLKAMLEEIKTLKVINGETVLEILQHGKWRETKSKITETTIAAALSHLDQAKNIVGLSPEIQQLEKKVVTDRIESLTTLLQRIRKERRKKALQVEVKKIVVP